MIVSDKHKFAFVHIPKCAGTSIRSRLRQFDDSEGIFAPRVAQHPYLGMLDYTHIPLFVLQVHFPEVFTRLENYEGFAILRDPTERFASSFSQHLKMYGRAPLHHLSKVEISKEIRKVIGRLKSHSSNQSLLPHDLIHFQRQVDYVFVDERRIVENLFSTQNVQGLLNAIGHLVGDDHLAAYDAPIRENPTMFYKSQFARVVANRVRPVAKRLVHEKWLLGLSSSFRTSFFSPASSKKLKGLWDDDVFEFISEYYAHDFALLAIAQ